MVNELDTLKETWSGIGKVFNPPFHGLFVITKRGVKNKECRASHVHTQLSPSIVHLDGLITKLTNYFSDKLYFPLELSLKPANSANLVLQGFCLHQVLHTEEYPVVCTCFFRLFSVQTHP